MAQEQAPIVTKVVRQLDKYAEGAVPEVDTPFESTKVEFIFEDGVLVSMKELPIEKKEE